MKGFKKTEAGAVIMTDETRKTLLVAYQERKQDEIMHPFLDEEVSVGILFHVQSSPFGALPEGRLRWLPAIYLEIGIALCLFW